MPRREDRHPQYVRCGARARTNEGAPCRNWALRGRTRCRLHGGATPPKQGAELARVQTLQLDHGAYMKLGTYQKALAAVAPDLFLEATASTKLDDEIRFTRAQLASLAKRQGETGQDLTGQIAIVTANLRQLVGQKHDMFPGEEAGGPLLLRVQVVEGRPSDGKLVVTHEIGPGDEKMTEYPKGQEPEVPDPVDG